MYEDSGWKIELAHAYAALVARILRHELAIMMNEQGTHEL
jgi:hypothetical protein